MLPETDNFSPRTFEPDDEFSNPESPLDRLEWWTNVELDLGDGPSTTAATPTSCRNGPAVAGTSCATSTRRTSSSFVDPDVERYWMGPQPEGHDGHPHPGGVDLYVGGVEHAVLHLLYARFWHKVLFDLGHLSSKEPYYRLFNQGYILAEAFKDEREIYVEATEVDERDGAFFYEGQPVTREWGKMGKSLKNAVVARRHLPRATAPTRCGSTRWRWARSMRRVRGRRATSSACIASCSACGATSSTRTRATLALLDAAADLDTQRLLHRTIDGVRDDMEALRFNTAIAKLIELNNHLTKLGGCPARRRRAAGADGCSAGCPLRRRAVGQARPQRVACRSSRSPPPTRRCSSTTPSSIRFRSTARCADTSPSLPTLEAAGVEAAALADPKVAAVARRRDTEEAHRRARTDGQHRRLTEARRQDRAGRQYLPDARPAVPVGLRDARPVPARRIVTVGASRGADRPDRGARSGAQRSGRSTLRRGAGRS